jgi:hypothetical protein
MNFEDLRKIILEIQDTIPCRECEGIFNDKDIRIIGTVLNEGFFHLKCSSCTHSMIVNVIFGGKNRKHRKIQQKKDVTVVTKNDILDMRNFLKGFDGNFKKIFTPNNKKT